MFRGRSYKELLVLKNYAIQEAMSLEKRAAKQWEDAGRYELMLAKDINNPKPIISIMSAIECFTAAGNCEDMIVEAKKMAADLNFVV